MGVLAIDLAEHQRADAERVFHRHLEADAVAREAAEPGAVIVLGQLGAVGEQLGDRRDLQGRS